MVTTAKLTNPPTKTITLQQAQEMGLITTMTKFVPQTATGKHALLLNKAQTKAIKIIPQVSTVCWRWDPVKLQFALFGGLGQSQLTGLVFYLFNIIFDLSQMYL